MVMGSVSISTVIWLVFNNKNEELENSCIKFIFCFSRSLSCVHEQFCCMCVSTRWHRLYQLKQIDIQPVCFNILRDLNAKSFPQLSFFLVIIMLFWFLNFKFERNKIQSRYPMLESKITHEKYNFQIPVNSIFSHI